MKYLTLSVLFLALIGCANNNSKTSEAAQQSEQKALASDQQLQEVTLKIEGMTCAHGCAATIEKNLNNTEGVAKAKVDFDAKTATISFDAHKLSKESLISVIEGSNGGDTYTVVPKVGHLVSQGHKDFFEPWEN